MSEAKFTPGPLVARGSTPSRVYGMTRKDKESLLAATGSVVPESGANAYLIAVAPEMYEELQEVSNWLNSQLGMGDWHKDIEKLLAKARGESC